MTCLEELKKRFPQIWSVDFEYKEGPKGPSDIVCMVAKEIFSDEQLRISNFRNIQAPLFLSNHRFIVLTYNLMAEAQCFDALGWPQPKWFLDLMPEYLNLTNNKKRPHGKGLAGFLMHLGIPFTTVDYKDTMRHKILNQNEFSSLELEEIIQYCADDVQGCINGFLKIQPHINIDHALLRSKSVLALYKAQKHGVHVDKVWLEAFQSNSEKIKSRLIADTNQKYNVFEDGVFKQEKFKRFLRNNNIGWPLTISGLLDLREETFKEMALSYPILTELKDTRKVLAQLRLVPLPINTEGNVPAECFPFGTITGRFQPLAKRNIFARGSWMKNIICPPSAETVYYEIDVKQEEFGVAAALSNDENMIAAYNADDCYLSFGKQAGLVSSEATSESHPKERELFKQAVLSQNYLQSPQGLADKLNISLAEASLLISKYRGNYSVFWAWSIALREYAYSKSKIETIFGWKLHIDDDTNERTIANFPMQGNSAEILRLSLILLIENKIKVVAVNHDAFLIETSSDDNLSLNLALDCISTASRIALNGFDLKFDVKKISTNPTTNKKGKDIWIKINTIMEDLKIHPCQLSTPPVPIDHTR